MSIIIDDKTLAVFRVDIYGGNLIGAVRQEEKEIKVTIRIRMEVDDKVWDSQDPKCWYEVTTTGDPEMAISKLRFIMATVPLRAGPVIEIRRDERGAEGIMEKIMTLPGMHKIELPPKEKRH